MGGDPSESGWSVDVYRTRRGDSPVEEWLSGLPVKTRAKVQRYLEVLEEFGPRTPRSHAKPVTNHSPLWELLPDPHRILYFADTGRRFVLLHGFRKKSMKLRRQDIRLAERRWADHLERGEE